MASIIHWEHNMALAHVLGVPRIGPNRELKFAQEAFWRSDID